MKRKTTSLLLLLLALMMVLPTVSSAAESGAEPGFFGRMAQEQLADERLSILEQVAEKVSASATADNGISFEVGQAFYVGDRIFIAYKIGPSTDLIQLHEGAPDGDIQWDNEVQDWVEGEIPAYDPDVKKEHDWLDGKGQRWLETPLCLIWQDIALEDGTLVPCHGGMEHRQEDASVIGWLEFTVPADKATGTLIVTVTADSIIATRFQDQRTFRMKNSEAKPFTVSFTLHQVDDPQALKVLAPAEERAVENNG